MPLEAVLASQFLHSLRFTIIKQNSILLKRNTRKKPHPDQTGRSKAMEKSQLLKEAMNSVPKKSGMFCFTWGQE